MSQAEFTAFLRSVFGHLATFSVDGAIHFQCMDWRHVSEIMAAGTAAYTDLKNICVWAKNNGGMGSLYRSQHEFVFVFKSGTAPHINNVELGKHGRYRTNVSPVRERYGEAFWRAHHEAWIPSELNQREYCEAYG